MVAMFFDHSFVSSHRASPFESRISFIKTTIQYFPLVKAIRKTNTVQLLLLKYVYFLHLVHQTRVLHRMLLYIISKVTKGNNYNLH